MHNSEKEEEYSGALSSSGPLSTRPHSFFASQIHGQDEPEEP
jgi:hypothetical protein